MRRFNFFYSAPAAILPPPATTIFITHDSAFLPRMRTNKRLELGIHPNYNILLTGGEGEGEGGKAEAIVAKPFIHHSGLKEGFVLKKCVRQKLADEALLDLMFHPC